MAGFLQRAAYTESHINGLYIYASCVWHLSFNIMSVRFFCFIMCISSLFLLSVPFFCSVCSADVLYLINILKFIYPSSFDEHLSCFQLGIIMSKSPMNICVQVFMFHFSWIVTRSRTAGSQRTH